MKSSLSLLRNDIVLVMSKAIMDMLGKTMMAIPMYLETIYMVYGIGKYLGF